MGNRHHRDSGGDAVIGFGDVKNCELHERSGT
jgi:hypothetical protein